MAEDKKQWMKDRWLDQVCWFDEKAVQVNRWHSALRIIAITGGVLVPGLVSVSTSKGSHWLEELAQPLAFVVSLLVAASVGLDGFFHFGERWLHYRRTAELLKIEGWSFIEGAGPYRRHEGRTNFHDAAFPTFATQVEKLVRRDVEVYLTEVVQEKPEDREQESQEIGAILDRRDNLASEEER
jgi:hypothetical protein